jgi:hypothetical protein
MRSSALVVAACVGWTACQPDRAATPGSPTRDIQSPMSVAEEELMIDDRSNGVRIGGEVSLDPYDAATWSRLLPPDHPSGGGFMSVAVGQASRAWDFGWFDPVATDGGCRGDINNGETETNQLLVDGYLNQNGRTRTPNTPATGWDYEVHPTNTSALERHCIRPGKYTISNGAQTFVIEYIAPESNGAGAMIPIYHNHPRGTFEAIEADQYTVSDGYIDLGLTFEEHPGSWTETRVLEIDNAGSNRLLSTFTNADPVSGSATDWFRFSTANSSTNYPADSRALFLSRLFYDYGVDQSIRTEYYDITGALGLIRSHQFGSHVSGSRCVIVGFELKRPDEQPANVADQTRQIGIGMTCPTGPDLMPMPIAMSPTTVNPGGVTSVTFREHNVGTVNAPTSWTGRIYLSADAVCCSGDVQLDSYTEAAAIVAGSYADVSRTVTVPTGTAPGQYYLFANLDATGAVAESNEANNAKAQVGQLTVNAPPTPDLTPSQVTFTPGSVAGGAWLTVTARALNQGNATAASGWQGRLYLSTDNTCCAGDVDLGAYTEINQISAGTYRDAVVSVLIPGGMADGQYYVFASLDAGSQVAESNENNNIAAAATTLTVTNLVACATFERTTTWKIADQIFNAGCSTTGANIQYRWRTDAGGAWTAYSTSPLYEFLGHPTAGDHIITLEVKNTSTGASVTHDYTISVQNFQLTMTGTTTIPVKGNYTYTASTSSTWWERVVPNTTWTGGVVTGTTWSRTWGIGCYDVDVRADATAGGSVLKRGRLLVHVISEPGCQQP